MLAIWAVLYRGLKVICYCSCKGKSPGNDVELINVVVEREELCVVMQYFGVVG